MDQERAVDAGLELVITDIVRAVGEYLRDPTEGRRDDLTALLKRLDDQLDAADAQASRFSTAMVGASPDLPVVGATSSNPIAEEVPDAEFQAQVAVVKAAKRAVGAPSPDATAALRLAHAALAAWDTQG